MFYNEKQAWEGSLVVVWPLLHPMQLFFQVFFAIQIQKITGVWQPGNVSHTGHLKETELYITYC